MKNILVIVLKKCAKESAQPIPFINGLVIGVEHFARHKAMLFYELIQIFVFFSFFEEFVLRVSLLHEAFEKIFHSAVLLKIFADQINMLPCKILACIS